jgi:Mg-chelatase subunit ChlD
VSAGRSRRLLALAIAVAALGAGQAPAAAHGPGDRAPAPDAVTASDPVMLVVDVSGSMDDDDGEGTRKIEGAKVALLDYLGRVQAGTPVGLRTYPNQTAGADCNNGELRFPARPVNPQEMSAEIRGLEPDGDTPTAEAIRAAAEDLKDSPDFQHGTLVIVSDGESTCDDPCKAAKAVAAQGIDLDALTVGFKISDEGREELECIADALSGHYLDVDDSEGLGDALDKASRPRLQVTLNDGPRVKLVAGGEPDDVSVTVKNNGEKQATDAIAQLSFAEPGFDVRRPVTRIGNVDPHQERTVTWSVRAGPRLAGHTVRFDAVARANNATTSGSAQGEAVVEGVTDASQAGEILKGPGTGIAILGDSYSAGEGADDYLRWTDSATNGCHRSLKTYLKPKFPGGGEYVLACSGAVSAQVNGPNRDNHETPQTERLESLQDKRGPVRAVAMTTGGNDASFGDLAMSCLIGRDTCTSRIFYGLPLNPFTNYVSAKDFEANELDERSGLRGDLITTYRGVNAVLNSDEAVSRRQGRAAPILVPGYPLPVPLKGRTCNPMLGLFSPAEIDFAVKFAVRLNTIVEEAVETARRNDGVPVFFVPVTELAFQPRHTACDDGGPETSTEPFARGLKHVNGAGNDFDLLIARASPSVPLRAIAVTRATQLAMQETAHPNQRGYDAETLAILRWSRSPEARAAAAFTRDAGAADPAPTSWPLSDVNLGQLEQRSQPVLQGGTSYPLTESGFAPGSQLQLVVESEPRTLGRPQADASGNVRTVASIPRDIEGGDHELVLSGVDPGGKPRVVRIAFKVNESFSPPLELVMAAGSLLLFLAGFGLYAIGRRRGTEPLMRGRPDVGAG